MPTGKKVNFLTDYQKKYIEENYHNTQTWEICETLGVTKKQVNGHAWNKKLKKDEDFIPLREDSTTSQEDLDFLIENYSQMSQTDLCKKLNWDKNRVLRWGKKLNLSKDLAAKKIIQNETTKVKRYGYHTGNCIPCHNKSRGSKHMETMKKMLITKAVSRDFMLNFLLKKNMINVNRTKLLTNKLG